MKKARLFYDGDCPVCSEYIRFLQSKLDANKIEYINTPTTASDFQYITSENQSFTGTRAIEHLAVDFPEILNFFWMLPSKYKIKGLKAAYNVGSTLRKIIKRKKGGCGCKKKKTT